MEAGQVFPPALVSVLRARATSLGGCLDEISDALLEHLLTTVFFAGLETYEGERNPVAVALLGRSAHDLVLPDDGDSGAAPLYQWKVQRFDVPRPFTITELVKLAVAGAERRIYSAVQALDDSRLCITGLAREGFNVERDPFVKVMAHRPGTLTVRSGRDMLVGYDRGVVLARGDGEVFSTGPVLRVLERFSREAGLDEEGSDDYLDAVRSLVRSVAAHGRGGILIIDREREPAAAELATYRMANETSIASLIRLARRIEKKLGEATPSRPSWPELGRRSSGPPSGDSRAFGQLLRNAFLSEAERTVEQVAALTGIDGATLLNRELALIAFGVILPVGRGTALEQSGRPLDVASRGTRHRAGATYAAEHPGSVVFVASEDGHISCMFREATEGAVMVHRLGPGDA